MTDEPTRARDPEIERQTAALGAENLTGHVGETDPDRTEPFEAGAAHVAAPSVVAGYDLEGELGRGGMGVVYRAIHVKLRRKAALKMVLGDTRADSKEIIRFLAEAEAVAAVQHPHVVGVYDFGEDAGRPFLALELCPGGSLAQRLKAGRLVPREAAELIGKIATGVAAAHASGIVHRDLKPGNILFDEHGEPKVSDFGLAKRGAGADLTRTNAIMGTPAYMSPEQAKGETKFVGPTADVWALGVMLYECLTGQRPFTDDDPWALLHKVQSAEPPSARTLSHEVPRDLDLICRKCLAKLPHERYPTAAELADDLNKFLEGLPILARPAGMLERAWKWTKRNKPAVAVIMALAAMAGIASWQAVAASVARADAQSEAQNAKTAGEKAVTEQVTAEAVAGFLYEMIAQSNPHNQATHFRAANPRITVKEAMDYAVPKIAERFADRPLVEAALRAQIGSAYHSLGEFERSIEQQRRALEIAEAIVGPDHPDVLSRVIGLAASHRLFGQLDLADAFSARALDGRERVLGPDHPDTLIACTERAELLWARGDAAQAESLARRAVTGLLTRNGPDHPDTIDAQRVLGLTIYRDRPGEAEPMFRHFLAYHSRAFGPRHPNTVTGHLFNGDSLLGQSKFAEAAKEFEAALSGCEAIYAPDHRETLITAEKLGSAYVLMGDFEKAEPLIRRAIAGAELYAGPGADQVFVAINQLGVMYYHKGEFAKAEPLLARALAGREKLFGPDNPLTLEFVNNLAGVYLGLFNLDRAEAMFRRAHEGFEKHHGAEHAVSMLAANNLAAVYFHQGKYTEAEQTFAQLIAASEKVSGPNSAQTLGFVNNRAVACIKAGNDALAESLLLRAVRGSESFLGRDHPDTLQFQDGLGRQYVKWERFADAEPLLRRVYEADAAAKPNAWVTFLKQSRYGEVLLRLGKTAEAEPLLTAGFAGLAQRQELIPLADRNVQLRAAADRLVRFYDSTGKPDEAAKWRAVAEEYPGQLPSSQQPH